MSNDHCDGWDDGEAAAPPRDPLVQNTVEETLALYAAAAPAWLLESLRGPLEEALTTHPHAVGLVKQLGARRVPERSEEVPRQGARPSDRRGKTGSDEEDP